EWTSLLGGSNYDWGRMVKGTRDGGCVINGYNSSTDGQADTTNHGGYDYWVVKLNCEGNLVWEKGLGGSGYESGYPIIQTNDDGYLVSGVSTSNNGDVSGNHGGADFWVVKLDCIPPTPAPAIAGDTLICGTLTASFQIPCLGNASGYNWVLPNG